MQVSAQGHFDIMTSELAFPVSDFDISGVKLPFLRKCLSHAETQIPLFASSIQADTRLTENYSDAFIDTHGLSSVAPFIFKTGPAWPKSMDSYPLRRELRPISNHPIQPAWDGILADTGAYLERVGKTFTAVMALGFANVKAKTAFCPLVVTVCVEPETIDFEVAKSVAEHVKINILAKAGFDDIEVAIWEFETFLSGAGPELRSSNPMLNWPVTEFRHPFTSTLGIAIAPSKQTGYEGSLGMFMTRGDGSELLAITAAHVARPPPLFPDNKGLSEKLAEKRHEEIVVLGNEAYRLAVKRIETEIGKLLQDRKKEEERTEYLRGRLESGEEDEDGTIASAIGVAERTRENGMDVTVIKTLDLLHSNVTKYMSISDNRCIGHVLFADPIGVSSDGYTNDWAALKISKDAFGKDFQGNKIYIGKFNSYYYAVYAYFNTHTGDKLNETTYMECMYPHVADREGYEYPRDELLPLRGVVPESELLSFKQLNANGDPSLAVVQNGRTMGTTMGWVSNLKSLVRHFDHSGLNFWSCELTIIGARGAFSAKGDSGSIIADRGGRIVALLTGGGGSSNATEVTFATPYCQLEKRIKEVMPDIRPLD